jgi:tetratricopeptide (TPR) repeat protein
MGDVKTAIFHRDVAGTAQITPPHPGEAQTAGQEQMTDPWHRNPPARDMQKPQATPSRRKSQGYTILVLWLAVLGSFYFLAYDGVSMLYHNLASISLSKGIIASEPKEQDALLRQAGILFREALRWNSENKLAYANLGDIYLIWEQKSAAQEAFERVIDLAPQDSYANYQLGFLYNELGQEDAALRAWQKAGNAQALFRQGLSCRGQGLDDCAEKFFKLTLTIQPEHADAYFSLGMLYTAQGRDTEAVEAYTAALQFLPRDTEKYYLTQAHLHSYSGRWNDAIAAYQQAIKVDPYDADTYMQIGAILLGQFHDESGAVDWYQAAVKADPQNTSPSLRLANFYWTRQDYSLAEQWYQRVVTVATDESRALAQAQMGLSRCMWLRGNREGALLAAQAAVNAQPDTATYHVFLADMYVELQRNELAITSYQTALALDPSNYRARRQLDILGKQEP